MRDVLGKKSYMDTLIPSDIILDVENITKINSDELDEIYCKLEEYYRLYLITDKWHKSSKKVKPIGFKIITNQEKMNMTSEQLQEYYNKLIEFYKNTKKLEESNNRKIIRLSTKKEELLTDDEYAMYLKQLRIYDDNSKISNLSLKTRQKLVPLLRTLLRINRISSSIKIHRLNTKLPEIPADRPIIFVLTHAGKDDQLIFSDVIKHHYTILSGDYESLHNNIESKVCNLNGIEYFDMRSAKERSMIEQRIEKKLLEGDNILCSMEAAWNLSANVPVLELFPGMIRSAIKTNAVIMPVGIELFNKKLFGINVSEKYFDPMEYVGKYETEREMLIAAKNDLRQLMADIKMQLYFDEGINEKITVTRESIGNYDQYNAEFKKDILDGWTFTEEAIKRKAYNSKEKPENVFQYVIKKYENIESLYKASNDTSISEEFRNQALNNLKNLLIELSNDLKNPVYPNEIHNQLEDIYNNTVSMLNNKEIYNNEEKVNDNFRK